MRVVDLRSDTLTMPTPAMRQAMYDAELGDDVYGEDPTVNRLEEKVAERLGTEAALLVVSGTMGNLVALLTHCGRGGEVILGDQAHIFFYECGGISALGGVQVRTVPNLSDGTMDPLLLENAIRARDNVHFPRTSLICVENTQNRCGGAVLSVDQLAEVRAVADRHQLPVHMDGARIFNAAIALGVEARELAAQVDSVQLCFSKGLAAPVGSAICGSTEFIAEARRNRKMVGGGMRQAGVIAAAALVALDQMVDRLAEDHENAAFLARRLSEIDGLDIDTAAVQSNIVRFGVRWNGWDAPQLVAALAHDGIKLNAMDQAHIRAVTRYGITRDDVAYAADVLGRVAQSLA
jgi:threonine aldolase